MQTMTVDDMFTEIRISLRTFAVKYTDISAFQTFYDALSHPMTYKEFHDKYLTIIRLDVNEIKGQDLNPLAHLKALMRNYMYARSTAGDSLTTTQKTIGPQHALLHMETRNPQLLEMKGLLQRLGEMTTVSKHT
jgi:hypothetical protein